MNNVRLHRSGFCLSAIAFLGLAFFTHSAMGQTTVDLSASKDNTLYQTNNGDTSNGVGVHFFSGKNGPTGGNKIRRGVIAFDLSSIPPGAIIQSVTMTLNLSKTAAGAGTQTVGIHLLSKNWGEGNSDAPGEEGQGDAAATNDATWLHTFYNSQFWSSAGGDFNSSASASASVGNPGNYNWSSSQMATDVQNWIDNPGTNYGWLVKHANESSSGTAKRFDSRQNPTSSNRPVLTVAYCTPPKIVINEIDYDQPGTDSAEFIELYNAGICDESLNGYDVVLVNGDGGGASIYETITMPNVTLQSGAYFVICGSSSKTVNCDMEAPTSVNLIQNGSPDAVGLRKNSVVVDAVSYEGNTGSPYTEGSGVGLEDDGSIPFYGISRVPDGEDTDVNNEDLQAACITPGFSNVTNAMNCTVIADAGDDKDICEGSSTIIGGIPTASKGTGSYTYSWSPATGLNNPNLSNPSANPSVTTTYVVAVTDEAGSMDTDTMTVSVNSLPVIGASANPPFICPGDSSTLMAVGALTYSWAPPDGLDSTTGDVLKASPPISTFYTVVGTDSNGCEGSAIVALDVLPVPLVDAGPNRTTCLLDSVQLLASGAAFYSWSPSIGLSCTSCENPKASPPNTTTYTVTGTDPNGCEGSDAVQVTVLAIPNVAAFPSTASLCDGDCIPLTASGAITYEWLPTTGLSNPNIPNPTACPTGSTVYTVTGTAANGCKNTATVNLNVADLPSVDAGADQTICLGESTTIGGSPTASGGSPPYSYSWSPSGSLSSSTVPNPTASPASATCYTVTVTDGNLCQNTDEVCVTVNPLPNIDAGPDQSICSGACAQLLANNGVSYVWDSDLTLSCTNCGDPEACPSVTTDYYVTGMDANGCENRDTVRVTVGASITVTVNPPNPGICPGDSVQLTASGASTYLWSPSAGLSCNPCSNPKASPAVTTTYTVVGTGGLCSDTTTVTVTVFPLPPVNAGPDGTICFGDTFQIIGSGAQQFSWNPTTGLSCTTCPNPLASPPATTTYTLTGTSGNGCQRTDTVRVTVHPPTNVVATASPDTLCVGQPTTLSATGASSYIWFVPGPIPGNPITQIPTATTTYTVIGTDVNGCIGGASITVIVNPNPTVVATATPDEICQGDTALLSVAGLNTYVWSPCPPPGDCDTISPAQTTTYSVTGTDANGCAGSGVATVTVNLPPQVIGGPDTTVFKGSPVQLFANGAITYTWDPSTYLNNPNIPNPISTPQNTIQYTVTGADAKGCTDIDVVVIFVDTVNAVIDPALLNWTVYPNPADAVLTISGTIQSGTATFEMRDALGRLVVKPVELNVGPFSREINVSELCAGWYAIVLRKDGAISHKAVMIE